LIAIWTLALIAPGSWFGQTASTSTRFSAAKALHFVIYALLAGASGWLPLSQFWRLVIALPLLSAHGALTEFLQTHVAAREGCVRDWIIDSAGILLGFALSWRRWPADQRVQPQPVSPTDTAGDRE
jgi:VanZ family protein